MTALPLHLPVAHVARAGRDFPCPGCHVDLVVFGGEAPGVFEYLPVEPRGEDGRDLKWNRDGSPAGWIPLGPHRCAVPTNPDPEGPRA